MTSEVIFIFVMSIALLWAKPGPGQALKVTTALNSGFLSGFSIAIGITIICNVYLLIAIFGTGLIAKFFSDISLFFKLFGAAYLFYLGYKGLKNKNKTHKKQTATKKSIIKNISIGFLMALSNPITIFYFVGILPGLIDISQLTWPEILVFSLIMNVVGLFIDAMIILLATQFKTSFENEGAKTKLNISISIGFILIGLYLLYLAYIGDNFSYNIL